MEGLPSILRTLDRDIAAGVAGANDKDALAAHNLGTLIVGGMLELTGEGVLAGVLRDLGPPVVAVGDDDTGVLTCRLHTAISITHGDVPAITVSGCDGDDLGVEGQMVEQTEVLGVGAEVAVDLPVRRIVGIGIRHREVGELRKGLGRDEMRRLIDAGVLRVEVPVAAEVGGALIAVGIQAHLEEVLQRREPVGSCTHNSPCAPAVDNHAHSILGGQGVRKRRVPATDREHLGDLTGRNPTFLGQFGRIPLVWRSGIHRSGDLMATYNEAERLLTPAEVAQLFRVHPKTVSRWVQSGKLSAVRTLGGHRRYRANEVYALLEETGIQTVEPLAP